MKPNRLFLWVLIIGLVFNYQLSCTKSPFEAKIAPEPRIIKGFVDLLNTSPDDNIFVWLEGFDLSTRTDESGFFSIEIPKELNASTSSLNGIFKLYFYVANYEINIVNIPVRNGLFLYDEGDLSNQGSLTHTIQMHKILNIFTLVDPQWVPDGFEGQIDVQVTLQATFDSVTVIYPKSVGGLLGGVLLRNLKTQEIFVDIPDEGASTRSYDVIGTNPKSRRMVFELNGINFRDLFLPLGTYEVIPYFLIEHDNLPQELVETIAVDAEVIGKDFLKIPYRRVGGDFRVIDIPIN